MALFPRLRDTWRDIKIDYRNLKLYDSSSKSPFLKNQAKVVLSWAQLHLKNETFPRDNYRKLMQLLVVLLGGTMAGFSFKLPGPYHHARWVSKCLYLLKIYLLSTMFELSEEELLQVATLTEFILLHYTKYWFTTACGVSSARSDLDFMSGVRRAGGRNEGENGQEAIQHGKAAYQDWQANLPCPSVWSDQGEGGHAGTGCSRVLALP